MGRRILDDDGQALPLVVVMLFFGVLLLVLVARFAPVVDDAARVRTAADAAALAGAADGRAAAVSVAAENGGRLLRFDRRGPRVTVIVEVGMVRARASALATGEWKPG